MIFSLEEADKITICGHKVKDLIILAELYEKKGIILENSVIAFEAGYDQASEDFNKALKQSIQDMTRTG